jgi:hypothetical protein
MPKYLITARYRAERLSGLQKDRASIRTTALLTVEETDRVLGKNVDYRAPGG